MKSELIIKESLLVWMQDRKKQAPKRVGDWRRGFLFPFACSLPLPLPFLCLPRRLGRNRKIMVFLYGNLAALSNLALTGELHWLHRRLRTNTQGLKTIEEDALPLIGHLQMVYILQSLLGKD